MVPAIPRYDSVILSPSGAHPISSAELYLHRSITMYEAIAVVTIISSKSLVLRLTLLASLRIARTFAIMFSHAAAFSHFSIMAMVSLMLRRATSGLRKSRLKRSATKLNVKTRPFRRILCRDDEIRFTSFRSRAGSLASILLVSSSFWPAGNMTKAKESFGRDLSRMHKVRRNYPIRNPTLTCERCEALFSKRAHCRLQMQPESIHE